MNPPELGLFEELIKRMPHGTAIVQDEWPNLQGHRSHSFAKLWKHHLVELVERSAT